VLDSADYDTMHAVVHRTKAADVDHFATQLCRISRHLDNAYGPSLVVVEAPIVGASGNAQTAMKIAMAVGAVAAGFECPVHLVAPATWKKEICGHGHSSKVDVVTFLAERHPDIFAIVAGHKSADRQDLVDAACLALEARRRLATPGGVPGG
jgi:Holliday junction resolvasome RuvABC endonuclease subunit